MIGIYKITSPSGKVYIGQSWSVEKRLYRYKHYLSSSSSQSVLHNSFLRYGPENHEMEILVQLSEDVCQDLLDYHEIKLIKEFKVAGFSLLNVTNGGQSWLNLEVIKHRTEKRKLRVLKREILIQEKALKRKSRKEKLQSELDALAERKRIRLETREERYKQHSVNKAIKRKEKKQLEKITRPKKVKVLSTEHVEKTRLKNLGKKRTQEVKDKLSQLALNRNYTHSEESKQKISEAKKEFFKTNEVHNKGKLLDEAGRKLLSDASTSKRPVLQLDLNGDLIKEWSYIKEAAIALDIKDHHISRVCKGQRPTAKGFKWKYKDDTQE